jgi:hypothetical protein
MRIPPHAQTRRPLPHHNTPLPKTPALKKAHPTPPKLTPPSQKVVEALLDALPAQWPNANLQTPDSATGPALQVGPKGGGVLSLRGGRARARRGGASFLPPFPPAHREPRANPNSKPTNNQAPPASPPTTKPEPTPNGPLHAQATPKQATPTQADP